MSGQFKRANPLTYLNEVDLPAMRQGLIKFQTSLTSLTINTMDSSWQVDLDIDIPGFGSFREFVVLRYLDVSGLVLWGDSIDEEYPRLSTMLPESLEILKVKTEWDHDVDDAFCNLIEDGRAPSITSHVSSIQLPTNNPMDASRHRQRIATITTTSSEQIRLNYIECSHPASNQRKGVILLIHGFPQTSYQFRHVITPLSDAGYQVIAPDYRGAGQSSKPLTGYEKTQMAEDLHILVRTHLNITEKTHVVGHDIGGMIAFAYASRYPTDVASLIWGECPLPGSSCYERIKGTSDVFHFVFHQVPDLPEALIAGKERAYCKHFFDKIIYNSGAITPADLDHYALAYEQPGAIRAALEVYRAFERDAEENREWRGRNGKMEVPSLLLMGGKFMLAESAGEMASEFHEGAEVEVVAESGHYIAEENPDAFVKGVLKFVRKHRV
ncbi:hypothetical protein N0V83_007304 [Neocucurbitaria cava]|uniref:AB hydrolase-1 domain-containing protein n=1 Tax=Neocucurbitaria cava TaxID=798079 RepID=A0A9W8Y5M1_9PLEO|nr:hypothetical protein N0V83_007304 [Neocucurbitaria cava]